ncbi:50S ribosomal protein L25/general stress protein Ctc [Polaribacter aquimarinus]|uniref:Large ribosomal subunit protein bL25 n=1 Tax=Polaribacter aquimarinus TaxID=2100726 RepID=A0A2U2JCH9_9FLAO|nr:50S ribosomal protein L25/general stress protein Ctc [Polaribacter aquimarinus]PWG06025.1 50S ribosomal protein L25 [Polaribacter aquimarinus]
MKSITIKGSKRESVGKSATKALRNAGMVPCVIYGGKTPIHFSAEEKAFKNLVYTPNVYTASIDVDGQTIPAILQDIQFHPVTDRILHVDFYQLFDDKEVTMNIPVKLTGTSPGVLNGGSLRFTNRKLKIKAVPANLPDFVSADISKLKIGNKLFVTELKNDDYTFMHPDNTVVVQVRTSRNAVAEEETEETTEAAPEATAAE